MLADIPIEPVPWRDSRLRPAWLVLSVALLLGSLTLPRVIVNFDEYYYAGQAFALSKLRAIPSYGDPLPTDAVGPAASTRYPLGWPLLLGPARAVSFRAMFVLALLVHIAGGAGAARMLVRRGIHSGLVALYVFHPVLWLYSRTLMSDVPAAALTLIAMDLWEEDRPVTAALVASFTTAMRLASWMTAAGLVLALAGRMKGAPRRVLRFLSMLVSAGIGLWFAQALLLGSFEKSGYVSTISRLLTGAMWTENLPLYLGGLALLPPFSLLAAVIAPRRTDRWAIATLPILVFFALYSFHDTGNTFLETFIGGQRFMATAIGILFVATSRVWGGVPRRAAFPCAAVTLLGAGIVTWQAQRLERPHFPALEYVRACKPERLGYNAAAARVAGSVEAPRFTMVDGDANHEVDIVVFANRPQSNNPVAASWELLPPSWLTSRALRVEHIDAYTVFDLTGRCPDRGEASGQQRDRPANAQ